MIIKTAAQLSVLAITRVIHGWSMMIWPSLPTLQWTLPELLRPDRRPTRKHHLSAAMRVVTPPSGLSAHYSWHTHVTFLPNRWVLWPLTSSSPHSLLKLDWPNTFSPHPPTPRRRGMTKGFGVRSHQALSELAYLHCCYVSHVSYWNKPTLNIS